MDNTSGMQQALLQAHKAAQMDEVPIGAVIVRDNQIIAQGCNAVYHCCDPTGHAEMVVLRQAALQLGTPHLSDCDLYVTLEPCMMCAGAIAWSRIRRLYFGAYDPKGGAVVHGPRYFDQPTCHHKPEIIGGIMESECGSIVQDYFKRKRLV